MFRQLKQFFQLFCKEHIVSFVGAIAIAILASVLEMLGIASVLPFLKIMTAKDGIESYPWLYTFLAKLHLETPLKSLIALCFLIVVFFIIKNLYMIFYQHISGKILFKTRNTICEKFLNSLFSCDYVFFSRKSSDLFINVIDNTTRYATMIYLNFFMHLLVNSILAIFIFGILLCFLFHITFFSIFYAIICSITIKKLFKKQEQYISSESTLANTLNISLLQSIFFSAKELKVVGTNKYFIDKGIQSSKKVNYLEQLGRFLEYTPSYLIEIALISLFFLLIVVLGYVEDNLENLVPKLGLLAVIIFRLAPIMNRLATAYSAMKSYQGSIESLNTEYCELLSHQRKEEHRELPAFSFNTSLSMRNVSYAYHTGKEVLQDISLDIKKYEFIGIVGPSGAGKSTLVDLILGLLKPSAGEYTLDGKQVQDQSQLASLFGYVAQSPFIITGTMEENIALGRPIDRKRVEAVMTVCKLEDFSPETSIMEFGKSLSGGQKQRIAIARALYSKPQILILDEATSSLDLSTEAQITTVINSLKGQCTIITIAHRLSTLQACDRLFYIKAGHIVASDSFSGLYHNFEDFKRMVQLSHIEIAG